MSDDINNARTMGGIAEGALLADRYRVMRPLGHGGMGSVWLVADTEFDNKLFAVKMLPAILVGNKRAYRQLKDEALVAQQLVHPNIVQIRYFEENNSNPFLLMDYIDGQTLDDYLAEKGALSAEEVIRILRPIAAALDYAHGEGVVHRDVKPANVIIRKDGHPFILDFGIARESQEALTRVTGKLSSGTLLYMSPEQLKGEPPKPAQDVYSFAAMAYECLKGASPFTRGNIEYQIMNTAPAPLPSGAVTGNGAILASGVMAGLAKTPENRPPSCTAVLGGRASPRSAVGVARFSRSVRTFAVFAVLAAFVSIGVCFLYTKNKPDQKNNAETDSIDAECQKELDRQSVEAEQLRLNAERHRLRAAISRQYHRAKNALDQVATYRKQLDGFKQRIENIDSLWATVANISYSDDNTLVQLTNTLMSVSNAVEVIQSEKRWLEESKDLRDAILSLRNSADLVRKRIEDLGGDHWQALPNYISGTNSFDIASVWLANGELKLAMKNMKGAIDLLRKAYSEEQRFLIKEKNAAAERKVREIAESEAEKKRIADDALAYTNCLVQISSFRKDVSNEYAKIELYKRDPEGFTTYLDEANCLKDVAPEGFSGKKLKAGDQGVIRLSDNMTMSFRWCPPGTFRMGSPVSEQGRYPNEPLSRMVKIEPGFWMSEMEITAQQWATIMQHYESDEHLPKVNITWNDCKNFVQQLNNISEDKMWAIAFSLPSEEQWEYACRSGTDTPYWWGKDFDPSKANGNKCDSKRHLADAATANGWNLLDMSGNVWEWCNTADGERALLRGGAYDSDLRQCRSAKRQLAHKSFKAPNVGFRVIAILNRKENPDEQ